MKKLTKIELRNRTPGKLMTGMNTLLLLDGKPLESACGFKFEVDARGVAKATIVLYADVVINAQIEDLETIKSDTVLVKESANGSIESKASRRKTKKVLRKEKA